MSWLICWQTNSSARLTRQDSIGRYLTNTDDLIGRNLSNTDDHSNPSRRVTIAQLRKTVLCKVAPQDSATRQLLISTFNDESRATLITILYLNVLNDES